MRGSPQDLFDDAGAYLFARNRERNNDHLAAIACDAVAAGVQVIDEKFSAI